MNFPSAYTFAVVCEAPADRETATGLADRVLCQEVEWIEPDNLELHRRWRGLEGAAFHLEWHEIGSFKEKFGVKAHGSFQGLPGAPDAFAARLALMLFHDLESPPDAVILIRDTDGHQERRLGLEQARRAMRSGEPWPFEVVLGVAHPKRECWVLAGFDPQTEEEEKRLSEFRQELGSDPRLTPETLTAKTRGAIRNAKRVLAGLVAENPDRERVCWKDCDLETLRERGARTGLTDYLEEVRAHLVPIMRGSPPRW